MIQKFLMLDDSKTVLFMKQILYGSIFLLSEINRGTNYKTNSESKYMPPTFETK